MKREWKVEITDTFGGEANYCWVRRLKVKARSMRGAISAVSRKTGYSFRIAYDCGNIARYNAKCAAVCCFIEHGE